MHIRCSCGVIEEIDELCWKFVRCIKCCNVYCSKCSHDLVYKVHSATFCECKAPNKEYFCGYCQYMHCDLCTLPRCDKCYDDEYNDDVDNCPKCNKRLEHQGRQLCEICYSLCEYE